MSALAILLFSAPVVLAFLLVLAVDRALWRRRERAWRRWEMSVEEEMRLREGLRGL